MPIDERKPVKESPQHTVFIGNLPRDVKADKLKVILAKALNDNDAGGILDIRLVYEDDSKKVAKGFGFVDVKDESTLARALESFKNLDVGGRKLRVDTVASPSSSIPKKIDQTPAAREKAPPAPPTLPEAIKPEDDDDFLEDLLNSGAPPVKKIYKPLSPSPRRGTDSPTKWTRKSF